MTKKTSIAMLGGVIALGVLGWLRPAVGQDTSRRPLNPVEPDIQLPVEHPECVFFGPQHDSFVRAVQNGGSMRGGSVLGAYRLGVLTDVVSRALAHPTCVGSPASASASTTANPCPVGTTNNTTFTNTIDQYIFQALTAANVTPAPMTTDYEFVRRVTLDLTGRIPTAAAVTAFVGDTRSDKRSRYIETLLATSQWVDKWTMWFGDFFQNNSQNTQVTRFPQGVKAFNDYVRASLSADKPYDQMAREIISAQGDDSYTQGEINFLVGGVVTGGPVQDIWDQQTANIAQTFLGIAHVNCLLCHNGRGHLDSLSLWGSQTTRQQAWGLSSFLSHTDTPRTTTTTKNGYYWGLADNTKYKVDYPLNTLTGNRPARQPTPGGSKNVSPAYLWGGQKPSSGQDYRVALAQTITADPQFARAAVNYMWAYFFGMGIVDPPNQFDPARLDPNNPPTTPWPTDPSQPWPLQPSNPQLLNALAQDFISSGYDLKALMREITNSQTYQLSSRYNGTWDPSWQNLFGRKLVRRLWAEELHDAITQSSGMMPTYNNAVYGQTNWAMQLQEPLNTPDGGNGPVNNFLNAFLRGNRDDQPRSSDGSISQALDLMNDNFVMSRSQFARATTTSILKQVQPLSNNLAITDLFLTVLSRPPTSDEMSAAMNHLSNPSTRNQELENLLWSLYNKVDFVFNY